MISPRLMNAVYSQPWLITGDGWLSIHQVIQSRMDRKAVKSSEDFWRKEFEDFIPQRPGMEIDREGIAHIHVFGVLGPKLSNIEKACGTTDYGDLTREINEASENARGILLHVDSPGGYSQGNQEAASVLAAVAENMPVVAHADGMMASAAYCICAGASRIHASISAMVGSIGVILPLVDVSGRWQQEGIKPAYVTHTGGDLKDAGYPPSFTDEHMAHFQEVVDDLFHQFRDHVLKFRSIEKSAMRGQVFVAERAQSEGLVDEIGTAEAALSFLSEMITR